MTMRPFTIALSGKGGTGKTTVSSLLVRSFIDAGEIPVLAVDADPNANFHEALGVEVKETLGSMREEAFSRNIPPGMNRHDYVRFRFRQALVEANGFDLVAMGRPEGTGCYCFANDLLSECMQQLEREYRFLVIDTIDGLITPRGSGLRTGTVQERSSELHRDLKEDPERGKTSLKGDVGSGQP